MTNDEIVQKYRYIPGGAISIMAEDSYMKRLPAFVQMSSRRNGDNFHSHDYIQVWYVINGNMTHQIGDTVYNLSAGDCAVILPFVNHNPNTLVSKEKPVIFAMDFNDRFFHNYGIDFFSYYRKYANFEGKAIPDLRHFSKEEKVIADSLAEKVFAEFSKHKDMDFKKLTMHTRDFFEFYCRGQEKISASPAIKKRAYSIERAIHHISKNFKRKISIEELCEVADMPYNTFTRNFKEITGKTVVEFITRVRLNRLFLELIFYDKSIDEIARDNGFSNGERLAHVFSSLLGFPPSEYKKIFSPIHLERDPEDLDKWSWYKPHDYPLREFLPEI
ncbi:MAG: helix-turn-helix transcriptional regulator [Oscillospiraceae bacterium]|nr:helix-turn-helix transcriptional regulator [Oscillospiraceae bacterium]MBQ7119319.1 helix-turn-helix transcriptional regulator [Oscillospiraceae bacterium]